MEALLLISGSLLVGFISAMLGIGGGLMIVPLLSLGLGYGIKTSIATSLLCVIVTSLSATRVYLAEGLVDVHAALSLETASVIGAIAGAKLTISLPERIVEILFGSLLILVSIWMIWRTARESIESGCSWLELEARRKMLGVLGSLLAGLASGMFGIGGGTLKVPLMLAIGIPVKTAVATSSLMIGVTAATGSLVYIAERLPDPLAFSLISIGILPGATLGARTMRRIDTRKLAILLAFLLAYAGLRMII